jgi:hypothetical protein
MGLLSHSFKNAEGLKVRDFSNNEDMTTINEGAEILKDLVKGGFLQLDVLKTTARLGKESEIALKMLKNEGFRN